MTTAPEYRLTRRNILLQTLSAATLFSIPAFIRDSWARTSREAWKMPPARRKFSQQSGNSLNPSFMDMTRSPCRRFHAAGEQVHLRGIVRDETRRALQDVQVLLIQPAANGSFSHPGVASWKDRDPGFRYLGMCRTDREGGFEFLTVLPGPLPWADDPPEDAGVILMVSHAGYRKGLIRLSRNRLETGARSPAYRHTFTLV